MASQSRLVCVSFYPICSQFCPILTKSTKSLNPICFQFCPILTKSRRISHILTAKEPMAFQFRLVELSGVLQLSQLCRM